MESVVRESIASMHTRLNVELYGPQKAILNNALLSIKEMLNSAEMMLSCHNPEALAARLNHFNTNDQLNIPDEFYDVLNLAKTYYQKSGNLFDVTLGSGRFIFDEDLTDFPANITQHTATPFHLDFGGFGKGYALRKIRALLLSKGIKDAFLSFGGTSILCLGTAITQKIWHYALPEFPHISFHLDDESVSISANSNSAGESNHIIYPDTFKPANTAYVVAVKCKDALDAEILSTSLILAEFGNFQQLLNNFPKSEAYVIDKIEPEKFLYLKSK